MPVSEFFRNFKRNKKKTVNFKLINGVLLVLIGFSIVYYVAQVNDLVVKGFELRELKNSSKSLANEYKHYSTYATSLKSYSNLSPRVEKLGMVESEKVDYVRRTNTVAVR